MLELSRIQAISLDLDDTLWPVWPTIAEAELRLQEWLQPRAPGTAALFANPQRRQALRAQTEGHWPEKVHDLSHMRREMIRLGLQHCAEDQSLAEPAFATFFAARQVVTLYPDALPALARLASRWPILALSNGNADVNTIGIGRFFCGTVSAREVGVGKPDARIFQAAAERLQLAPEQVLHVGDDEHLDVLGALAAGMQTAWINRANKPWSAPEQPHASLPDMAALCNSLLA
jgi:putative hydrolase of the HAD superfamily